MASFSSGCRILRIRESSRGTQAMAYIRISAYTDKLSVKPGDTLRVMASTDGASSVRAQLVRLIHGDEHPDGPGFVERPVASSIDREWPACKRYIQKGNFLHVADPQGRLAPTGPFTLHAYIFPTLPGAGRQVLLGRWSVDATSGFRAWHQSFRTPRILGRRRRPRRCGCGGGKAYSAPLVFRRGELRSG